MKTHLAIATTLFACMTLPALAVEQDTKDTPEDSKIKALEAEIAALRAQLRAEGEIRGEDRNRQGRDHDRRAHDGHHGHDEDGGHTSQFEYVYELDGDLRDAPLGMIRSQLGGMPAGSKSRITINGQEVSVEQFMELSGNGEHHEDRHEGGHQEHRVMHFSLGDMTGGEIDGEIHIEIEGDMGHVPGFLPGLVRSQRDGHGGQPMMFRSNGGPMGPGGNHPFVVFAHDDRMHDAMMDEEHLEAIHLAVMEVMEHHYRGGREMFDQVHDDMARHGGMDPFEAMELLIRRVEQRGQDPHPLLQLRDELMHEMGGGGEHEDPFFREGGEFVGKMQMSGMISEALSDQIEVAIFGIWEARQHLSPQHQVEMLEPILMNPEIELAVRNAAAMVLKEAFIKMDQPARAREVLSWQIRRNGSYMGVE